MITKKSSASATTAGYIVNDLPKWTHNEQCVAYVADLEYLFPTLLSALQARRFASTSTDVLVLMSEKIPIFSELRLLLGASGVLLIDAAEGLASALGRLDPVHFQGRISVSTMAKLVLPQVLPEQYGQIIYLDGDTQITGPLAALENAYAPAGKFFAARDYTSIRDLLYQGKRSDYFNAGVLKFNREGWIGETAFELFVKDPEACKGKHDQGALNEVCGSALLLISNRWNFPKQFLHLVDTSSLSIIHYMAHPKPWHGTFFPWGASESQVYSDLRRSHPLYASLYRGLSFDRKIIYKYRSIRERFTSRYDKAHSSKSLGSLFLGEYVV